MYLIYGENRGRNRISPEEDWVTVVIRASDVQNQQIMLSRPKGQQAIGPLARQASLLSTNSIQFMPKTWFAKRCKGESPRETPNKTPLKNINIYIDKHGNKTHQKLGFFSFTTFYRFDFLLPTHLVHFSQAVHFFLGAFTGFHHLGNLFCIHELKIQKQGVDVTTIL